MSLAGHHTHGRNLQRRRCVLCDSLEQSLGSLPQASFPFADFALYATVITSDVKSIC